MAFSKLTFTVVTVLVFACHMKTIEAEYFMCYSCNYQYSNETSDDSCITDPQDTTSCAHNMCTVSRTWNIEAGRIESFNRACQAPADQTDNCEKNSKFEWCYTYCRTSYCNNGTGIPDYDVQCYSCSYNKGEDDNVNCISNPGGVADPVTNCSSPEQCYTFKQINIETGKLQHVSRGCADTFDTCSKHDLVENCTSVCRDNLCNDENVQDTTPAIGFQCYLCNCAGEDCSTDDCFTKPREQPTVFCEQGKYCYVHRINILETGDIWNFARGCEVFDNPKDICTPEATRETCETFCQNDHCNDGDGIPKPKEPPTTTDPPIDSGNRLVVGVTQFLVLVLCALCWH